MNVQTNGTVASFWRAVAVALLTFVLGAGSEWVLRGRDTIGKADLDSALSIIQKELDQHSEQLGSIQKSIVDSQISIGQIEQELKDGR